MLNILSNVFGFIGTVLIFLYGVPRQVDNQGKGAVLTGREDKDEIKKIKTYKRLGSLGLGCIALSFVINILLGFCAFKSSSCLMP